MVNTIGLAYLALIIISFGVCAWAHRRQKKGVR